MDWLQFRALEERIHSLNKKLAMAKTKEEREELQHQLDEALALYSATPNPKKPS